VAVSGCLSPLEMLWIWADRWRGMQTLLELAKEANTQFKGLRCMCHILQVLLLHHSYFPSVYSTINVLIHLTLSERVEKSLRCVLES